MNRSMRAFCVGVMVWVASGVMIWVRATPGEAARLVSRPATQASASDPGLERFRSIYKELVETNTTLSAGDCTLAAKKMAARLAAAGYPEADLHIFEPEGHPKEGGLIAVLHGSDANAKATLMLAHAEGGGAKREGWAGAPFKRA